MGIAKKTIIEQYELIAAIANKAGIINIGKILSNDNFFAPPIHGNRKRSWNVSNMPDFILGLTERQQIILKYIFLIDDHLLVVAVVFFFKI